MEDSIRLLDVSPERGSSTWAGHCGPCPFQPDAWTSVVDIPYRAPASSSGLPPASRSTRPSLPRTNPSFEMAFFLRNTQPPKQRASDLQADRRSTSKYGNGLRFLGVWRSKRLRGQLAEESLEDFIPSEGVRQKISKDGG